MLNGSFGNCHIYVRQFGPLILRLLAGKIALSNMLLRSSQFPVVHLIKKHSHNEKNANSIEILENCLFTRPMKRKEQNTIFSIFVLVVDIVTDSIRA